MCLVLEFLGKIGNEKVKAGVERAEHLWVCESLRELKGHKNFGQWKVQFGLFQDKTGIWRCGGRLGNANLSFEAKHPAILPSGHRFTSLVILRAH